MKQTHDYLPTTTAATGLKAECAASGSTRRRVCPQFICSQLPENNNTSVTNMAEDIAAEVIEHHGLHTPLTWIEHYPEHKGEIGEWSLVSFSSWEVREFRLYGIQRRRVDSPRWSHLETDKLARLLMPLGERGEGRVATGSLSARRMQ